LGCLKDASEMAEEALKKDKNLTSALSLLGRIKIEEKKYVEASEFFKSAISSDLGNPRLLLWSAYANYLNVEFSSGLQDKDKKYQEEITIIIRILEKANKLTKKSDKEIKAFILYFLGFFYFKSKDIFSARKKLEDCIRLKSKSSIKVSARDLLYNIWNYQSRPTLWQWWLNSPLSRWPKRITFFILLLSILGLLLLHPFIPIWFPLIKVNYVIYEILIAFLVIILLLPRIERIKTKEIEIEIYALPPLETILPLVMMEEIINEMEMHKAE